MLHITITAFTLFLAAFTTLRTLRPDNAVSYSPDRRNGDALLCAIFWTTFYLLTKV